MKNAMRGTDAIQEIRKTLAEIDKTWESRAIEMSVSFAAILILEMRTRDMNNTEFAALIGVDNDKLERLFYGDESLSIEDIAKIVNALGVKVEIRMKP